ncbi:hypothetical protein [Streptomyces sp. NPDC002588]
MYTVNAHADTAPGDPPARTTGDCRDRGHHEVAPSGIRLLTRPGAMP